MIRGHLQFDSILRPLERAHHDAGVIDENVEAVRSRPELGGAAADGRERRKIERQNMKAGTDPKDGENLRLICAYPRI